MPHWKTSLGILQFEMPVVDFECDCSFLFLNPIFASPFSLPIKISNLNILNFKKYKILIVEQHVKKEHSLT